MDKATLKHLELLTTVCKQLLYERLRQINQTEPQAAIVRQVESLSSSMNDVRQKQKGGS